MSSERSAPPPTITALMHAMRETSALGVLFSQTVAGRLGIASSDLECLDIVVLRGPVTAGDLAAATGLTTGAITGVIDRLEQAGFVRRMRDTADRRKVLVGAQPSVMRRIQPLFQSLTAAMADTLGGYSDAELQLLADFHRRAREVMQAEIAKLSTGRRASKR